MFPKKNGSITRFADITCKNQLSFLMCFRIIERQTMFIQVEKTLNIYINI